MNRNDAPIELEHTLCTFSLVSGTSNISWANVRFNVRNVFSPNIIDKYNIYVHFVLLWSVSRYSVMVWDDLFAHTCAFTKKRGKRIIYRPYEESLPFLSSSIMFFFHSCYRFFLNILKYISRSSCSAFILEYTCMLCFLFQNAACWLARCTDMWLQHTAFTLCTRSNIHPIALINLVFSFSPCFLYI